MLLALVIMWGSAFMFTKIAVEYVPPLLVVAGRMTVAAIVIGLFIVFTRRRLTLTRPIIVFAIVVALLGNLFPFFLISWGQQVVDSGLAGILMAFIPLMTMVLSHYYLDDEPLHLMRILSFLAGVSGVALLLGPSVVLTFEGHTSLFLSMLAIVLATLFYSISIIVSRRRPKVGAVESSALVMWVAVALVSPLAWVEMQTLDLNLDLAWPSLLAVLTLGIFSTALPAIVYFRLIDRTGPNFIALMNYMIPVWAVLMGVVFLDERFEWHHLFALCLIITGLALSNRRRIRQT